jgi:hypothetical protein
MRNSRGIDDLGLLELDPLRADILEQPRACAEQDGHEMNPQLIKEPSA